MSTHISQPNSPPPSLPLPLPVMEWSVLAAIAVWGIKQVWQYLSTADQKDRDADRALLTQLIEDLRAANRENWQQALHLLQQSQESNRWKESEFRKLHAEIDELAIALTEVLKEVQSNG